MFNRYFQQELELLREISREFALEHPNLAPALLEPGSDPDVERILEGTAFLTAGIRQKLDDDLPELTQSLIQMLWPHYLRPVPSASIVEFFHPAKPKVTATQRLRAGDVELDSVPVDGTACRFRTCYDVDFHPLLVREATLEAEGRGSLRVRFEVLGGANPADLTLDPLRLHLHGELPPMATLRQWLLQHTDRVALEVVGRKTRRALLPARPSPVRAAGFEESEGLFPYPAHSFLGYRLLQEYFTLPQKFLFFDVLGISQGAIATVEPEEHFDLVFHFRERPPDGLSVGPENIRLHCTPVVNLMARDADPIRLDHKQSSYLVRPQDPEPNHFEVYSVDSVTGLETGSSRRQTYLPFYAFRHGMEQGDADAVFYKLRRSMAVGKPNSDCHMSFVSAREEGVLPQAEIASVELTCTNRRLAEELKPGDICRHNQESPIFAEFHNISHITTSAIPPLEGGFHWRLISHLALNMVSLSDAPALRSLLSLYDFPALHNRQAALATQRRLESIRTLEAKPGERIFRGAILRGVETVLTLSEDRFNSEGELHLFSAILDEFFSLYISVNSYSQLTVLGAQQGGVYPWPPRVGKQFTL